MATSSEGRRRRVRFDANLNEVADTHAPEDYSRSDPAYFDEDNVIVRTAVPVSMRDITWPFFVHDTSCFQNNHTTYLSPCEMFFVNVGPTYKVAN